MRVVQVGPYPPPYGGVARNLVAIHTFLKQRQIPCAVVNITASREADGDEVYHPTGPVALVRLLLRLRPDIIHLHFGGMLTPRLLGLYLVCSFLPGRTVLTFHSGAIRRRRRAGRRVRGRSPAACSAASTASSP